MDGLSGRNELDGGPEREGRALLGKETDVVEYSVYTTSFRRGLDKAVLRPPWQPRGEHAMLPVQRARVRSLVRELIFHMLDSMGKKITVPLLGGQMNRGELSPDGTGCRDSSEWEMRR